MAWLLDTNIISETRRLRPELKVLSFLARHPLEDLHISSVTRAELRCGVELVSEGSSRRDELNKWLARFQSLD
jgi:predicted nucleic acid-binding protein